MKREEKSALSRQRILEAAIGEFSKKGYEGASLSGFCAERGISKGIVYHHFRDKNELYLLCIKTCFDTLTDTLRSAMDRAEGTPEERIQAFFHAWLRFFADHRPLLGLFTDGVFHAPAAMAREIDGCREAYNGLYRELFGELLRGRTLRMDMGLEELTEECRIYIDYYNTRFLARLSDHGEAEIAEQERRCRIQLDMLLYGILKEN